MHSLGWDFVSEMKYFLLPLTDKCAYGPYWSTRPAHTLPDIALLLQNFCSIWIVKYIEWWAWQLAQMCT